MSILEFKFDVTETTNCPIYKKGDSFELTGIAVTPPHKKAVCTRIITAIADIIDSLKDMPSDSYNTEVIGKEYNCGGCTGIIKFTCGKKEEGFSVPQFRLIKEFEAKKAMAAKMSAIEGQLKEFSFLNCLDEVSLKDFVSCGTIQEFPANHTILRIDTPGKNLFLLLSGKVELIGKHGELIRHLKKGEIFGEMSLMFDRLINATVKSVEALKVLVVSAHDFNQLLLKFPFIKMELARLIAKRLSSSNTPVSQNQSTSSGVSGQLKDLQTPELFQMIHETMKTGTVKLTLPDGQAHVEFMNGEVVSSQYNDMEGKDAFHHIIIQQDGTFVFNSSISTKENIRPIGGFMSMLMEGLRLLDEKQAITS